MKQRKNRQTQVEWNRQFSTLGTLQVAHSVQYQLNQTEDGWEIQLAESTEEGAVRSQRMQLECTGVIAYELLRFLYENAISLDSWQDVLEDTVPEAMVRE